MGHNINNGVIRSTDSPPNNHRLTECNRFSRVLQVKFSVTKCQLKSATNRYSIF